MADDEVGALNALFRVRMYETEESVGIYLHNGNMAMPIFKIKELVYRAGGITRAYEPSEWDVCEEILANA